MFKMQKLYVERLAYISVLCALASCGPTTPVQKAPAPKPQPEVRVIPLQEETPPEPAVKATSPSRADLVNAAQIWLEEATFAPIPEQQDVLLQSAAALIQAGRHDEAKRVLDAIDVSGLSAQYAQRKRLLRAQSALDQGNADLALRYLAGFRGMQDLWPQFKARALSVRARAYSATGQPVKALHDLVERERYLEAAEDIRSNRERIWNLLGSFTSIDLQIERQQTTGVNSLDDWLDLALLYTDFGSDPYRLRQTVFEWVLINPTGSAQTYAQEVLMAGQMLHAPNRVRKIALLLPLASKFAQAAQSVHEGFMAMWSLDGDPEKPEVVVYDVGEIPELATSYYRVALQEGANLVVGPLGKQAATAIVTGQQITVPTLLLGGVQTLGPLPPGAYTLDLAPEQEATQVAARAYGDGYRVAAVLMPESEWGHRLAQAFTESWESLGGVVVGKRAYQETSNDHRIAIQEILGLSLSEGRKGALAGVLGAPVEFQPRRRQDLDMIFLVAHPVSGRLIKPQINFFQAHDVPVYSTSHIYTGTRDRINDADLNRVIIGDMPWLLRDGERSRLLRTSLKGQMDNSGGLDRLYALGVDAYSLSRVVPYMSPGSSLSLKGVTGEPLQIGQDQRIERHLTWARFEQGEPMILEPTDGVEVYEEIQTSEMDRPGTALGARTADRAGSAPVLDRKGTETRVLELSMPIW